VDSALGVGIVARRTLTSQHLRPNSRLTLAATFRLAD
jgi:hypothetical protein